MVLNMTSTKVNYKSACLSSEYPLFHQKMARVPIWALLVLIFLVFPRSNSVEDNAKNALVQFMDKLSHGNVPRQGDFGWNESSDPCRDKWYGVFCDEGLSNVKRIVLERLNLDGAFDASSLCAVRSVKVLSLQYNNVAENIPSEIEKCKSLTHLYLSGNNFSGKLSESLSLLSNLKRLHIADNNFYGDLPNLTLISGLTSFLAENNNLSGPIPAFDFSNFDLFNVSNNNFSGPIPDVKGQFKEDSFLGNPYLCGKPLPNDCPGVTNKEKPKKFSVKSLLIYSGFSILSLVIVVFVIFKFLIKKKPKEGEEEEEEAKKTSETPDKSSTIVPSTITNGRSEFSLTSMESGLVSSLTVLMSSMASRLKFEELLKAPAELLRRGKHGSLYKVMLDNGVFLAVKRIKGWGISCEDFDRRMRRIDQAKHKNVLPTVAFYSSRQEKLLMYEYQQNGSLFKLLHESQDPQIHFKWKSRLSVASNIANALSLMHEELHKDGIAHGNLKSMNILFNETMDPLISEYGLMVVENQDQSNLSPLNNIKTDYLEAVQSHNAFKADVYAFGVILLELLTGKLVQKNGFDLPNWAQSVVKEERLVDVLDKALSSEGASEERMVKLLQVSLKCISPCHDERPPMSRVSGMINAIKEEEENSISFAP